MDQQQEGWPLGLRLLNARIGLVRSSNNDADYSASASASFTTLLTPSLSSASIGSSSSHLDSQSTRSFFHDKGNTLGSLIGISSIFEFSRRSTRGRMVEPFKDTKKNHKLKPWLFQLCSRLTTDAVVAMNRDGNSVPSLGHYLEEERRVANSSTLRKRTFPYPHGVSDFSPIRDSNSLFLGGQVAAPECATMEGEGGRESSKALLGQSNLYGGMAVFPCLCG